MPCNRLLLIDSDSISYQFTRNENYPWIKNVSSLTQYPASKLTQLSCVAFPALLMKLWVPWTFQVQFPVLVNQAKWNTFVIDVERFFGFFAFFPREIKVSVQSLNMVCKLTNQCSCPGSVHVLCISMEFLPANWRCELKAKMACGVGKLIYLIAEGHEHVANAVDVGVNTCYCFCFSWL